MKKSRVSIILILILIIMIIPVQNQGVKENEPSFDSLRPSLRGSPGLGMTKKVEPETHLFIYDSAKTAEDLQDNQDTSSPLIGIRRNPVASIKGISEYTERGPIEILNDSAFDLYPFSGSGTSGSPYIIDGYNITDSTTHLIHIENTTKYFNISSSILNALNSSYNCIMLNNVTHGTIKNNSIHDSLSNGISLDNSTNNTILNNTIYNCEFDLSLDGSSNNTVSDNIIQGQGTNPGIFVIFGSNNNTITNNKISNCQVGVVVYLSHNAMISKNIFCDFTNGISLDSSDNHTISGNTLSNSTFVGIFLSESDGNNITSNVVVNSTWYGFYSGVNCANNSVTWNNFINNNVGGGVFGTSQALNRNMSTVFKYNYWDDHTSPDADNNGFVDTPYTIDEGSNPDTSPRTYPWTYHAPIDINDNADFAALGFPGAGTFENPYVISSYYFNDSSAILIDIEDTTAYFRIEKNTINCLGSSNVGIRMDNVTHGTIENNTIYNTTTDGISVWNPSENNTFANNVIYNCGVGIYLSSSDNNTIWGNTIHDCSYVGDIRIASSNYTDILNNTLTNAVNGIALEASSNNNTLSGNTIHDCSNGMRLSSSSNNNTLTSNTVYDCATGIYLSSSSNNTLLSNTIHDIVGIVTGIHLANSHNNTLASNTIFNLTNAIGILLSSSNDNTLVGNNIFNITNAQGIYLGTSVNNTLSSNTIYNITGGFVSALNGIEMSTSINNTVFNNTIYNCGYRGIDLVTSSNNNTLSDNTIYDSGERGISLESSSNNTLTGNTISDCATGIFLSSSSNNTLLSNTIHDIVGGPATGIHLSNSHNNTLASNTIFNLTDTGGILLVSSNDNTLTGNTIYNITNAHGISLSSSNDNTLSSNTIYNITFSGSNGFSISGISLFSSSNNTVDSNTIYNCEYWGIGLSVSSNNNTLLTNTLYNCSTGINVADNSNNTLLSNIIYDCVTGMRLSSSNNNTLSGNTLYNIEGGATGIVLFSSSYNLVTNNIIYNATISDGINLWDSHNNTFTDNTIYECDYGFHLFSDSSNNTFNYNLVYNNTNFGFCINKTSFGSENNTVLGNTFINNKPGTSQVYINKTSNTTFMYNYYDDHPGLDANYDWLIDTPYSAEPTPDGELDPYPLLYPSHAPIHITDDAEFAAHGFSGTGILADPYLITNYYFVGCSDTLIHIEDTTAYFMINNSFFNCLYANISAIWLENVTHGTIENNTIHNSNSEWGIDLGASIDLLSCTDCTMLDNAIYNGTGGIGLNNYCNNTNIIDNFFYNCTYGAININNSHYNAFMGNTIINCTDGFIVEFSNSSIFSGNNIFNCSAALGIYLSYSSFNNTISFNNFHYCEWGVYIDWSSNNNTVTGNTISNCTDSGIYQWNAGNNNNLTGNTIFNCTIAGIYQWGSNKSIITGNTIFNCSDGIYLENNNHNNTLSGNTIYNCSSKGIYMVSSCNNTLTGNTIYNCTDDGIHLYSANNNTLTGNTIYNCISSQGISLGNSHNNTLVRNIVYNCTGIGSIAIYLGSSHNNTLSSNTVYDCDYAIYLWEASNNSICRNNIYNNTYYGLFIGSGLADSENNTVTWNNFIDNRAGGTSQAYDSETNNNISYNYWNNHTAPDTSPPFGIVDDPFPIDGGANQDPYPLTTPVLPLVFIITPLAQDYGTDTITVMLDGSAIHYWYYFEGWDGQNQTWTTSVDRTLTVDGTYTLHAYGNDTAGNIRYINVTFTIDTLAPTVDITSPTNTTYGQNSVTLIYTVSDGTVTIFIDDVANTTAIVSGSVISDLTDGSHNITIVALDSVGNSDKTSVIFTVDTTTTTTPPPTTTIPPTTPPTTTTTTTTTTTAAPGSFPGLLSVLLFFGMFVVFIRRRKKT